MKLPAGDRINVGSLVNHFNINPKRRSLAKGQKADSRGVGNVKLQWVIDE